MKKIKKLMAVVLCFTMILGSCVYVSAAKADQDPGQPYEGEKVSIGFIGWGFTDKLGSEYKEYFEYIDDAFGIDFNLVVAVTQDEMISQTESLIEAGVQGIISYQVTSSMMQLCEENGVYLSQFAASINDEELKAYLDGCEYWLGTSDYDHYTDGVRMADALYNAGCKNVITLGIAAGNPLHDLRLQGSQEQIAQYEDMTMIGEYRGNTASVAQEYSEQVANFITMYPELDGITMTGASNGCMEAVLQAIDIAGKTGEIKLATLDIVDGTDTYLEEGSLVFTLGGQYPEVVFLSIIMADVIRGSIDLAGENVNLIGNMVEIQGTEGYELYKEYIMDEFPYTVAELQAVTPTFNSEASLQDLYDTWGSYSLEDVMARHQH